MLFTRSRQWQSSSGCHRDGNDSDGTDTDATDAGVSYSNRQGQREPLKRHKERATPFSPMMMVHGWCNVTHRLLHLSSLFPRCARFAHHLPRRNEMCVTTRLLPFVSFVIASDSISTNWWEDNDLQWMATSCFVGVVGYFLCIRNRTISFSSISMIHFFREKRRRLRRVCCFPSFSFKCGGRWPTR